MATDRKAPTPRLEQAIAAARGDEPAPARLAQVRERISQQSAGAPHASGAAAPASAPIVKAAIGLGALGLIVAGASWLAGTTQPVSAPAPSLAPAPPRAPVHAAAEPTQEPVAQPPIAQPSVAQPPVAQPVAPTPARTPAPRRAPSKPNARPPVAPAEAALQKPEPPPEKPEPPPAQHDESELALLRAARAALAADPASALRLTDRHEQRFPAGVLREEREVIAIEALARTDRRAEARARADRFAASFPSSVHRERVTRAVGQP